MAIPSNYIDKITKEGDSRMICPAADKVRVENQNFESGDLDGALNELAGGKANKDETYTKEEVNEKVPLRIPATKNGDVITSTTDYGEIANAVKEDWRDAYVVVNNEAIFSFYQVEQNAIIFTRVDAEDGTQAYLAVSSNNVWSIEYSAISGGGEGTVTGVKVGETTYPPNTEGVVDISAPISNKVDNVPGKVLSTNDYTDAEKTKLAGLPTNPVTSISVNGQNQQTPNNGNVNLVVPTLTLDDAPTAGSDNAVKSGGIKTAIDQVAPTIDANGKWVIGGVTTDKDAQGPRGNTVLVNENAQGIQALIVNNVSDGGETDILSAEMGKVIRQNIMLIFNALGTYAFPEGKPILNWGSTVIKHSINTNGVTGGVTITDVEIDGVSAASMPAQIVDGKSLSLKLNLPTGMYVFGSVTITMDGVAITNNTGVWDESTGTIYIASVTGDISITAAAVLDSINNYAEQSHLVFQLDGLHKGPTTGKWTDLKGGVAWDNHGATELSDSWQFDGSSYLDSQNMVAHEPQTCTIEIVLDSGLTNQAFVAFTDGSKMVLAYASNFQSQDLWISRGHTNSNGYGGISIRTSLGDSGNGKKIVSVTGNAQETFAGKVNGQSRNAVDINYGCGTKALIGGRLNNGAFERTFTGKIYAIRIYDTILTEAQILANQQLDNERFNLGLTINS